MFTPPLSPIQWTPKRFKELTAAAQGKLSNIKGFLEFYQDLIINASKPGERAKPIHEIVGGLIHVEKLGEKYAVLKNFGMSDMLYYLRVLQAFGVIDIVPLSEIPRRLSEIGVRRTELSQLVFETLKEPEATTLMSMYASLLFSTPARHVMFGVIKVTTLTELAMDEKFQKSNTYDLILARQVLNRSPAPEVTAGRAWYDPISDLSAILAYLGVLQVVKIRSSTNKLAGIRNLSKIKRQILTMLDNFSDYIIPRGTLILEFEYLLHDGQKTKDEYWGIDYVNELHVGSAKDITWFKSKLNARAYSALEKLYMALKDKMDEIEDAMKYYFNELGPKGGEVPYVTPIEESTEGEQEGGQ